MMHFGIGDVSEFTFTCTEINNDLLKDLWGISKKYDVDSNIKKVIFSNPATIILWKDGTKTVVKCQDGCDTYDPEKGFAMAVIKYITGNKGNFNELFKKWVWKELDDK